MKTGLTSKALAELHDRVCELESRCLEQELQIKMIQESLTPSGLPFFYPKNKPGVLGKPYMQKCLEAEAAKKREMEKNN